MGALHPPVCGQQGWPRPPQPPHEPAWQMSPTAARHSFPAVTQRGYAKVEGTQQPPSRQVLGKQQGWSGPPQGTQRSVPPVRGLRLGWGRCSRWRRPSHSAGNNAGLRHHSRRTLHAGTARPRLGCRGSRIRFRRRRRSLGSNSRRSHTDSYRGNTAARAHHRFHTRFLGCRRDRRCTTRHGRNKTRPPPPAASANAPDAALPSSAEALAAVAAGCAQDSQPEQRPSAQVPAAPASPPPPPHEEPGLTQELPRQQPPPAHWSPGQQGWPGMPQSAHSGREGKKHPVLGVVQTLPRQQGWPGPPHASQAFSPPQRVLGAVHPPTQQGCPRPPHAVHAPLAQLPRPRPQSAPLATHAQSTQHPPARQALPGQQGPPGIPHPTAASAASLAVSLDPGPSTT